MSLVSISLPSDCERFRQYLQIMKMKM